MIESWDGHFRLYFSFTASGPWHSVRPFAILAMWERAGGLPVQDGTPVRLRLILSSA